MRFDVGRCYALGDEDDITPRKSFIKYSLKRSQLQLLLVSFHHLTLKLSHGVFYLIGLAPTSMKNRNLHGSSCKKLSDPSLRTSQLT